MERDKSTAVTRQTRRGLLRGTAALAAGPAFVAPMAAQAVASLDLRPGRLPLRPEDSVAAGYVREVVTRWGDRVTRNAHAWEPRSTSIEAAETQFGWDGRMVGLLATPTAGDGVPRGVLAVAHPTVDPAMAFPGGLDRPGVAAAMQGACLLDVERQGRSWTAVPGGPGSRRLSANTLCRVSGPATTALGVSARGLLNVSGGDVAAWGSVLLSEDDPGGWLPRLRRWDRRFAEERPFGWMVEVDPTDRDAVPVKRTALGRFAHGDAAAALTANGRAVVYMTDRRSGGHLFRFTSAGPGRLADALDRGVLAVAALEGEVLRWLDLPAGVETALDPLPDAARLGAAAFDHPSGLATDPRNPRLYLALRGHPASAAGAPRLGAVLQIMPRGGDHGADTAAVHPLFSGGAPGRFAPLDTSWPEHPDTLMVDLAGRVWIGTDRGGRIGTAPDMLFGCDTEGPGRGLPLPLYGAPRGAAVGGCAMAPDGSALFTVVRTPGAEPGASWDRPGTRWPHFDSVSPPRTAVVVLTRLRGGPVGGG